MGTIQNYINQIPVRHNLVSSVVLSGIIVGLLLAFVIFIRSSKKNHGIRLFGVLIFIETLIGLDIYLCYTGLMKYCLHLNDTTEPLVLMLGPIMYFISRAFVKKQGVSWKWDILHLLLPIGYALVQLGYYLESLPVKYNAYVNAYHPSLPFAEFSSSDFFWRAVAIKDEFRILVLLSFIFYLFLSSRTYIRSVREKTKQGNSNPKIFTRNILLGALLTILFVGLIFLNFRNDLGDHFITILFTIINLLIAGFLISESRFFENAWIADKYETSGLKNVSVALYPRIEKYVTEEKYYLNKKVSLRDLADKLNSSPNYISQAINNDMGINFNEYINRYRITAALEMMNDENYANYSIASIGESVGFNAKTTFYAAFKKQMGETPASYLKSSKSES